MRRREPVGPSDPGSTSTSPPPCWTPRIPMRELPAASSRLRPPAGAPERPRHSARRRAASRASSAFGGPCATPTAERLAAAGLKYNRFHTTALCAPTRQALLTGRNHHTVGMGVITELATSAPGLQLDASEHVRAARADAEAQRILDRAVRQVPRGAGLADEPDGPVRRVADRRRRLRVLLRLHRRRDEPVLPGALRRARLPIEPDKTPEEGYHFTEDMTDKAITWVRQQKSLMPDKPFFIVLRARRDACAAPRPEGVVGQVQGQVRRGLGRAARGDLRAARRSSASCRRRRELTARHEEIPAWDDMPDEMKPVLARQMEVYAGFLEHTDHHIGRLVDALEDLGVLEDTLVYYIIGDNGASAEGTRQRDVQRDDHLQRRRRARDAPSSWPRDIDELGTPDGLQPLRRRLGARYGHAVPVDEAGRLALGRYAQRHDRALAERDSRRSGEVRTQFHHVIDVAPTVLEAAGLPQPDAPSTASSSTRSRA